MFNGRVLSLSRCLCFSPFLSLRIFSLLFSRCKELTDIETEKKNRGKILSLSSRREISVIVRCAILFTSILTSNYSKCELSDKTDLQQQQTVRHTFISLLSSSFFAFPRSKLMHRHKGARLRTRSIFPFFLDFSPLIDASSHRSDLDRYHERREDGVQHQNDKVSSGNCVSHAFSYLMIRTNEKTSVEVVSVCYSREKHDCFRIVPRPDGKLHR